MTTYTIGSLDSNLWVLKDGSLASGDMDKLPVIEFDFMTTAQCAIFTLERESPVARASNLIVIPIQSPGQIIAEDNPLLPF